MSLEEKRAKRRAYYLANRDRVLARNKARYEAKREEILERQRAHRQEHPELIRERKARYYAANREAILEQAKEYGAANRDAIRVKNAAYRARPEYAEEQRARSEAWKAANRSRLMEYERVRRFRKKALEAEHLSKASIWERDGGVCQLCGSPADAADWHLDHVVPLAKGGSHTPGNVVVSHPLCNQSKHASDPRVDGSPWGFLLAG